MPIRLRDAELDAVLAGLRLLQQELISGNGFPPGIRNIYTEHGPGLTGAQIDNLCERLNVTQPRYVPDAD